MSAIVNEVRETPDLLACLSSSMEIDALLSLESRDATDEEMELILTCFGEPDSIALAKRFPAPTGTPEKAETTTVTSAVKSAGLTLDTPITTVQTALTPPEGVPWYDGPLFDSHIHMTGITNSLTDGSWTTSDVRRMMDRHNMVGGVAFWLPPIFGRQSEIDLLLNSIGELDDRLATLMMPPPLDLGFSFAFMGFQNGTYTRSLLEPWYPPKGPFDGFGEITFYRDAFQGIRPGDPQLDDVYPLMAETGGVVMSHIDQTHTAQEWAAVMSQYPEITFLFHGIKDFHGNGEDERAATLELLKTYEGDNLYYTLDAGPIMHSDGIDGGSSIGMDTGDGELLTSIVDGYGRQKLAEHVYSEYSKEIINHPDQVMFGTDFLAEWHFEDAANDVIIDFARRFIGLLPEENQEAFAYKNDVRAFGKYLDLN